MHDVAIVGGGLFGQIIRRKLLADGMDVVNLESHQKHSGSSPAACLMKPSWFSSLGKDVYEPSLKLLDELYGVSDIEFETRPLKKRVNVHWCDPKAILSAVPKAMRVASVEPGLVRGWTTRQIDFEKDRLVDLEARTVIVAAGIWSNDILPDRARVPGLVGRAGAAFLWPDLKIEQPFISVWAPYRQLVAFNRGDGAWVGDGSAIKPENWTEERQLQSYERCSVAIDRYVHNDLNHNRVVSLYGIRPYVPKVKPCYLDIRPGLIVATGGAKNGTLAAGWCAHKISEALR